MPVSCLTADWGGRWICQSQSQKSAGAGNPQSGEINNE